SGYKQRGRLGGGDQPDEANSRRRDVQRSRLGAAAARHPGRVRVPCQGDRQEPSTGGTLAMARDLIHSIRVVSAMARGLALRALANGLFNKWRVGPGLPCFGWPRIVYARGEGSLG